MAYFSPDMLTYFKDLTNVMLFIYIQSPRQYFLYLSFCQMVSHQYAVEQGSQIIHSNGSIHSRIFSGFPAD